MNILISNDDGIKAKGLKALVKAMSSLGNVYVVAPHTQRSASSHALSVHGRISLKKVEFDMAEQAYECDGTPADCVKLGLHVLRQQGIEMDIVYAGINHGGNLGSDTMYSGTVSAAAEGMMEGLPAVAVSVNSHEASHFEGACDLAKKIMPLAMSTEKIKGVISINTPNIPADEIKGVKAAPLGFVQYDEEFEQVRSDGAKTVYRYRGTPVEMESWTDELDVSMIREGYATISVIKYDLNDYEGLDEIREWRIQL